MTNKSPAFQFYPGDWLSDINVATMTDQEEGIYIRLLSYCWIHGSIPGDIEKIKRLLKNGSKHDATTLEPVLSCFHLSDSGNYTHNRLEKERKKQEDWKEKSSRGGKKSAEIRQNNAELKGGSPVVEDCLTPKSNTSSLSSSSSSTSNNKPTHGVCDNFEEDWNLYPRKAGNKKKARSCYHKSVGNNPEKRKQFLEKMQNYERSTQTEFLQYGETFFRNWESLEVDTTSGNGRSPPSPMTQATAGRGDFVDKVTRAAEQYAKEQPQMSRSDVGCWVIGGFSGDEQRAAKKILYDFQWIDTA